MADSTLNRFLARGTNAARIAFTPSPPTPASGPSPTYIWFATDTSNTYAWDGSAWQLVNNASGSVTTTGSPANGNLTKFSAAGTITNGDLSGDVTTSGTLATTIANNAVTTAKINNAAVTLAKIANAAANSKLLGAGAAGSGAAYAELTLGTGLSMSGTTLNAAGGSLTEIDYYDFGSVAASTREVDVTGYKEITIVGYGLVHAASVQRVIQVSVNGGSTWFTASGDYETVADTGIGTAGTAFIVHNTATTAARNISLKILNNCGRIPVVADNVTRQTQQQFVASATAINRIRLGGQAGGVINAGNFTAGTLQVHGRA